MKYKISPEDWDHIRHMREFHRRTSGGRSILWGSNYGWLYLLQFYSWPRPSFVWWKGIWFANTSWSGSDIPLPAAIPAAPVELARLFSSGQPSNKMLTDALKLGVLSRKLVPMAVAARIGVGT